MCVCVYHCKELSRTPSSPNHTHTNTRLVITSSRQVLVYRGDHLGSVQGSFSPFHLEDQSSPDNWERQKRRESNAETDRLVKLALMRKHFAPYFDLVHLSPTASLWGPEDVRCASWFIAQWKVWMRDWSTSPVAPQPSPAPAGSSTEVSFHSHRLANIFTKIMQNGDSLYLKFIRSPCLPCGLEGGHSSCHYTDTQQIV